MTIEEISRRLRELTFRSDFKGRPARSSGDHVKQGWEVQWEVPTASDRMMVTASNARVQNSSLGALAPQPTLGTISSIPLKSTSYLKFLSFINNEELISLPLPQNLVFTMLYTDLKLYSFL